MPDPADLDQFVAGLDYPMFVVTTEHDGQRAGCLVGFATQVSIDPQRMLVCLSRQNHTCRIALNAEHLAVHVLDEEQRELAALFGTTTGDETDKFSQCRWQTGPGQVPILTDAEAWMVGRVLDRVPLADHIGFVLEPVRVERRRNVASLTFSQVKDLSPGHPA